MDRVMLMEGALARAVSLLRSTNGRARTKSREVIDNLSSLTELLGVDLGDECCYAGRMHIVGGGKRVMLTGTLDIVSGRIALEDTKFRAPSADCSVEFVVHRGGKFWTMDVFFADKPTGLEIYAGEGLDELRAYMAGVDSPPRRPQQATAIGHTATGDMPSNC